MKKILSKFLVMIMLLNLIIPHMTIFANNDGIDLIPLENESQLEEITDNEILESDVEDLQEEVSYEDNEFTEESLFDEVLDQYSDTEEETSFYDDETNYIENLDAEKEEINEKELEETDEIKEVSNESLEDDLIIDEDYNENLIDNETILDMEYEKIGGGQLKLSMGVKKKI